MEKKKKNSMKVQNIKYYIHTQVMLEVKGGRIIFIQGQ
jgi:hypothetical protein